jgi:N4-(beta-N-acetylglucosaminyl)-L-asparaginase
MSFTRRKLMKGGLLATLAGPLVGRGWGQAGGTFPRPVVISSANGLRATAKAMELLKQGGDTLEAVIAGVNINEEDPNDSSVGYGGLPNEDGVVELDSSVMHGPTRRAGAVAALRNIKTPSKVAKVVMERTDHLLLVGEGALRFARVHGFQEDNLLTENSRKAWLKWKETMSDRDAWGPGLASPDSEQRSAIDGPPELLAWIDEVIAHPPTGTINCLAVNANGDVSGVTTTSGLAWKIAGRVGDSPIIGAGLFVDNDVGAGGSTGRGEENIKIAGASVVVEAMRRGASPREACLEALKRVAANYFNNRAKLEKFDINFYALRNNGEHGAASLWRSRGNRPVNYAVNDGGESRLVQCAWLLEH